MNQKNQVLKLSTAGSVDDGKSTLIGRILYDTHSLTDDKIQAIEKSSKARGYDFFDFSMATDGLIAEREQGITIDVAHIYFATDKRSYIIADTPGHVEYTRNMITGTSTADVSVILIDARNGVTEQTRRHFFISNLLRTQEVIVAINKMDLVNYDRKVYQKIIEDFERLRQRASFKDQNIHYIPISALQGENIMERSTKMSWYSGKAFLPYLENIDLDIQSDKLPARFQVQTVIRPKNEHHHDFRAYAGKLRSGAFKVGDRVRVLPSKKESKIKEILFFDKKYQKVSAGSSVSLTLEDDIQVSRGDLLIKSTESPEENKILQATICWMHEEELKQAGMYQLQFGVKRVKAKIRKIDYQLDIHDFGTKKETSNLQMNDLGGIELQLAQPLHYDRFEKNKHNGAFILIDPKTNATAGVGFLN